MSQSTTLSHRNNLVAELDAAEAAFKRGLAAINAASAAVDAASDPVAAVRKQLGVWLNEGGRQRVPLNRPVPKPATGERYATFIKAKRAKKNDTGGAIEEVKEASPPEEVTIAEVLADLNRRADRGRIGVHIPDLNAPMSVLQQRRKPTARLDLPRLDGGVEPDIAAMVLHLHRDEIAATLVAQVRQTYADGRVVLTDEERRAKLAELRAEELAIDHLTAEAWWMAKAAGESIPFPAGLSAKAILGTD